MSTLVKNTVCYRCNRSSASIPICKPCQQSMALLALRILRTIEVVQPTSKVMLDSYIGDLPRQEDFHEAFVWLLSDKLINLNETLNEVTVTTAGVTMLVAVRTNEEKEEQ